VLRYCRV